MPLLLLIFAVFACLRHARYFSLRRVRRHARDAAAAYHTRRYFSCSYAFLIDAAAIRHADIRHFR